MKKLLLTICLFILAPNLFAQELSKEEMLKVIQESGYVIDNRGSVTYSRVIEIPNTEAVDIYRRSKEYFVYAYGSGKEVIQNDDPEGFSVIGKGIFKTAASKIATIKAWHLIRIDAKDGRARVVISLLDYEQNGGQNIGLISNYYPLGEKTSGVKNMMLKCYYNTYGIVLSTFSKIEEALKGGNTPSDNNDNW